MSQSGARLESVFLHLQPQSHFPSCGLSDLT